MKKQKKNKKNKKISEMRLYDDVINHIYKICSNGILKMERKLSFKKLWDIKIKTMNWIFFFIVCSTGVYWIWRNFIVTFLWVHHELL